MVQRWLFLWIGSKSSRFSFQSWQWDTQLRQPLADGVPTGALSRPEGESPLRCGGYCDLTDSFGAGAFDDAAQTVVVAGAGGGFAAAGAVFEIIGPLVNIDTTAPT